MHHIRDGQREIVRGLLPQIPDALPIETRRTKPANLRWMLNRILADDTMPDDKSGRWIGFVHGVLSAFDLLDVDAERARTRPIMHAAYEAAGMAIPETQSLD